MACAASLEPWQRDARSWRSIPSPWKDFVASIRPHIEQMVVSHRPEHKMSGELHDETNYGRPYKENKKTVVHVRKRVSLLSERDMLNIVDSAVRAAVMEKATALGGDLAVCELKNDWPVLPKHNEGSDSIENVRPIKKVRIKKVLNVTPIGNDTRRRYVAESSNHHIAIYAQLDAHGKEKRWDGIIVSLLEAYERSSAAKRTDTYRMHHRVAPIVRRTLSEDDNQQFKFSLMGGDTIKLHRRCNHAENICLPDIYRVRTIAASGQLSLVKITDARMKKDIIQSKDWWQPMVDALRKLDCRKVVVDLLGREHPAND
jgi:hypothetical protein